MEWQCVPGPGTASSKSGISNLTVVLVVKILGLKLTVKT